MRRVRDGPILQPGMPESSLATAQVRVSAIFPVATFPPESSILRRPLCRAPQPENSEASNAAAIAKFGYASENTFQRDLTEFINAHFWAISVMVYSDWEICRDAQPDVPTTELPRLFFAHLRCVTKPGSGPRNPASKFEVFSVSAGDLDAFIAKHPQTWAQTAALRAESHRRFSDITRYTGLLAIRCFVQDTTYGSITFAPMHSYTPPLTPWFTHPTSNTPIFSQTLILEDMIQFCMHSINSGFPLGCQPEQHIPLPGRFSRVGGSWKWEPLFKDWSDYAPGQPGKSHPGIDLAVSELQSGLGPRELIAWSLSFCGR